MTCGVRVCNERRRRTFREHAVDHRRAYDATLAQLERQIVGDVISDEDGLRRSGFVDDERIDAQPALRLPLAEMLRQVLGDERLIASALHWPSGQAVWAGLVGFALALLFNRMGSLWASVAAHAGNNAMAILLVLTLMA